MRRLIKPLLLVGSIFLVIRGSQWLIWRFTPVNYADFEVVGEDCIRSFHEFAYDLPHRDSYKPVSPLPPWQKESWIPHSSRISGYWGSSAMARVINQEQEIWLMPDPLYASYYGNGVILIYNATTQTWREISMKVIDSRWHVQEIFTTSQGAVWGIISWNDRMDYPDHSLLPVLAKFNEDAQYFEVAEGTPEIPLSEDRHYNNTKIVVDDQDHIWIFSGQHGIYRYDPVTQSTMIEGELRSTIYVATLAPDGSIYFKAEDLENHIGTFPENGLFQLFPNSAQIVPVEVPPANDDWPNYTGLLADSRGYLWLGAIAFRDPHQQWQLIHPPYLWTHLDHFGQYLYAAPQIMMESSDGRLWFQKYLDTGGWGEGTAWYDPETGKGCMFTTASASIVEDSQQQLWMAAFGNLYKYDLKSQGE